MKRSTIFTAVLGLVAFGFAAYGLVGGHKDSVLAKGSDLDKNSGGRLGAAVL